MCSQQLSLLHWMTHSLISKIYLPQCIFFSKTIHLHKSYICWVDAIGLRSSSETNNTDRNSVNKQNIYIKDKDKENKNNTWKG